MEFNSYVFIFAFLPLVFFGYLVARKWQIVQSIFLFLASFIFYSWAVIWYSIPLIISAVVDYIVGKKINVSNDQGYRKRLLVISVIVNITLLSFFKYTTWITGEIATALAIIGITFSQINVALPPGVSFYTFQTMSYTLDIYNKKYKPIHSFFDYLAFVSFFPQLVAGPIERARDLLPQIAKKRNIVKASVASSAIFLILFGLFQKLVLADNFGGLVDRVFLNMQSTKGNIAPGLGLIFTYAFAFQIYCDFAAYSTIARGSARLFGIELSRNFLTPYFATSPSEFWSRWHITLSSWLRDYLYIPLGGNQHGTVLTIRNLVITMVLGGLWHGAGIFFIVWGLYHGLLLVFYRLVPVDEILVKRFGKPGKIIAIVIFFHLVCVGWIFFRTTPDQFLPIWSSIMALPGSVMNAFISGNPMVGFISQNWTFSVFFWGITIFAFPLFLTDYLAFRKNCEFPDLFERMPATVRVITIIILVYSIVFFAQRQANEFIYFRF